MTKNGICYTNEFNETWGNVALGCAEPMSDKQTRHSHVRIIEQSDARVVVHWSDRTRLRRTATTLDRTGLDAQVTGDRS